MTSNLSNVKIGHWTDTRHETGCTVVLFPDLTQAAVDVRGGAPGTRETDLLASGRAVQAVDAILLTGGSAFGLSATDGVVRFLAENGRGYPTFTAKIPIVSTAVLFDNPVGIESAPDAKAGYLACQNAVEFAVAPSGRLGAGAGCTIRKLWGEAGIAPAGMGISTIRSNVGAVSCIVAVNAVGAAFNPTTGAILGEMQEEGESHFSREHLLDATRSPAERESTTIGTIIVDAPVDHGTLERCAVAAHDGLARVIRPAHTQFDGDVFFAAGLQHGIPARSEALSLFVATEMATEQAVMAACA